MEFIFELLLELALEGGIEASKSSRVPKPVRIIIIALILLFFIAVIGCIFLAGILILGESILGGIAIMLFGVFLLIVGVCKFVETYIKRRNNRF